MDSRTKGFHGKKDVYVYALRARCAGVLCGEPEDELKVRGKSVVEQDWVRARVGDGANLPMADSERGCTRSPAILRRSRRRWYRRRATARRQKRKEPTGSSRIGESQWMAC